MAFNEKESTTLIARGTEISGDLQFVGSLEIEGKINGNISAGNDSKDCVVRIAEHGEVVGTITAPMVVINGSVKGDIHSSHLVELAAKARIEGNVHYSLIEMVKGAQIDGQLMYAKSSADLSVAPALAKVD